MEHKEELDSDTYRIIQASTDFEKFRQNDLRLYLSTLSPADVADFYWGDQAAHDENPVVATDDDFTEREGGSGMLDCVVKRSGPTVRSLRNTPTSRLVWAKPDRLGFRRRP